MSVKYVNHGLFQRGTREPLPLPPLKLWLPCDPYEVRNKAYCLILLVCQLSLPVLSHWACMHLLMTLILGIRTENLLCINQLSICMFSPFDAHYMIADTLLSFYVYSVLTAIKLGTVQRDNIVSCSPTKFMGTDCPAPEMQIPELPLQPMTTWSSDVAERPRDASCHWTFL